VVGPPRRARVCRGSEEDEDEGEGEDGEEEDDEAEGDGDREAVPHGLRCMDPADLASSCPTSAK
jgi:hypothetical protein